MRKIFNKLFSSMGKSPRERYLSNASDLADLEFRQKSWDRAELERSDYQRSFML